jgi:hypothetical protein
LPWREPRVDVNTLNLKNPVALATGFFFRLLETNYQAVSQGAQRFGNAAYWLTGEHL